MSGTEEGRKIVKELNDRGEGLLTTVATEYGYEIYEKMGLGHLCLQGRLNVEELSRLIKDKGIDTLIDATHPYAVDASANAIEASKETDTKYIRFQRESVTIEDQHFVHVVKCMDDAVEWCKGSDRKNILLATGFSSVEKFMKLKDAKDVFVRILPIASQIEQCIEMGVKSANILALQGPFSLELNKAIYKQYSIDIVVTKESGKVGGVQEKIQAAKETGAEVVIIERQELDYPVKCSSITEVLSMLDLQHEKVS